MKMILRQRDFWAGAMFVLCGLLFAIGAKGYTFGSAAKMGPGFFPTLLGCLLAGVGLLVLLRCFFTAGEFLPKLALRPLSILIAAICLYGLLLPVLGFVLATVLLVSVGAKADPDCRLLDSLLLGVFLSIFSTAVFHYGLGLPFPLWPNF